MPLHPLVQRLVDTHGAEAVTPATIETWAARPGDHALLLGGDPVRFPEVLDVAVVLPELQAAFARRFDLGVAPREHEDEIARRYGVQRWPSIVFVREGGWLGTLSGMRDWPDYLAEVRDALARTPGRAPGIGIPLVSANATPGASACH